MIETAASLARRYGIGRTTLYRICGSADDRSEASAP